MLFYNGVLPTSNQPIRIKQFSFHNKTVCLQEKCFWYYWIEGKSYIITKKEKIYSNGKTTLLFQKYNFFKWTSCRPWLALQLNLARSPGCQLKKNKIFVKILGCRCGSWAGGDHVRSDSFKLPRQNLATEMATLTSFFF